MSPNLKNKNPLTSITAPASDGSLARSPASSLQLATHLALSSRIVVSYEMWSSRTTYIPAATHFLTSQVKRSFTDEVGTSALQVTLFSQRPWVPGAGVTVGGGSEAPPPWPSLLPPPLEKSLGTAPSAAAGSSTPGGKTLLATSASDAQSHLLVTSRGAFSNSMNENGRRTALNPRSFIRQSTLKASCESAEPDPDQLVPSTKVCPASRPNQLSPRSSIKDPPAVRCPSSETASGGRRGEVEEGVTEAWEAETEVVVVVLAVGAVVEGGGCAVVVVVGEGEGAGVVSDAAGACAAASERFGLPSGSGSAAAAATASAAFEIPLPPKRKASAETCPEAEAEAVFELSSNAAPTRGSAGPASLDERRREAATVVEEIARKRRKGRAAY